MGKAFRGLQAPLRLDTPACRGDTYHCLPAPAAQALALDQELPMKTMTLCATALSLVLALGGCAQPPQYYQPSDTSASSGSGITVYGEIDASVVHSR